MVRRLLHSADFEKDAGESAPQDNLKFTIVGLVMAAKSKVGEYLFETVEPGKPKSV